MLIKLVCNNLYIFDNLILFYKIKLSLKYYQEEKFNGKTENNKR